jgi:thioredoxin 1
MKEFTDATFESEVLSSDKPVLVDFWAQWCGPCKALTPTIEQIAAEKDTWTVGKMDIQSHPQTAAKYGIRSIPALLFFKDGQVKASLMGAANKDKIVAKMTEVTG